MNETQTDNNEKNN